MALVDCVAHFRAHPRAEAELEIRLGTVQEGGGFAVGVTRDVFDQLEEDLRASFADADDGFTEVVDYHYATKQGPVRTRVTFDARRMRLSTEHTSSAPRTRCTPKGAATGRASRGRPRRR